MASHDTIAAGYDTSRVPAAVTDRERQQRADRDAAALRYLTRRDALDLAPMLGLTPPPRRPPRRVIAGHKPSLPARDCRHCGTPYTPTFPEQLTCGKSCGSKHGATTKRRQR